MHHLRRNRNKNQQQIVAQENVNVTPSPTVLQFKLKHIIFRGRIASIVLQHMSGPCPLLAVVNILSLRGYPIVHAHHDLVSAEELIAHVSRYIHSVPNSESTEENQRNFEMNRKDALEVLPKTFVGLDINVKFKGITSCAYTKEMTLFDFCKIRLVHGWLPDPQDVAMFSFLHNLSYDQLLDKLITLEDKLDDNQTSSSTTTTTTTEAMHRPQSMSPNTFMRWQNDQDKLNALTNEGLLAEKFLTETASQMTAYGLSSLHAGLYEEELCILFRNNHFSTLYKRGGQLFDLVTALEIASGEIAWTRLTQIDGNTAFMKSDFSLYVPPRPPIFGSYSVVNGNVDPIFSMGNSAEDAPEKKHRFRRYLNHKEATKIHI